MKYIISFIILSASCLLLYFIYEQGRIIKRQKELIETLIVEICRQDSLYMSMLDRKGRLNNMPYNEFNEILRQQSNGNQD